MKKNVIITGANRGIGLSYVNQYLAAGFAVYALCRTASEDLKSTDATIIEGIDVASDSLEEKVLSGLKGVSIDILINNAGILKDETLGDINFNTIQEQFVVNTLGPLRITEALLPQMSQHGKIAMMTSRMGSITDNTSGGRYGYRMSKAALNIASVSLAHDVKAKGISVAILHPGYVQTDMVGGNGDISADESARKLVGLIDNLNLENSGTFWHSNGSELPW